MKRAALLLPLLFAVFGAGCSATSAPALKRGEAALRPTWWAEADAAAIARLAREAEPLRAAPVCLGARLLETPDVAHAWWLEADAGLRAELGRALAARGELAYAASEAARAKAPEAHAQAEAQLRRARAALRSDAAAARAEARGAAELFEALEDPLLQAEARLVAAAAALQAGEVEPLPASPPARAQRAQTALLALGQARAEGRRPEPGAAIRCAAEVSHGQVLAALEELTTGGALPDVAPLALHLGRYRAAARRGEGERALLSAHLAQRAAELGHDARGGVEARVAQAQARLLLRQLPEAVIDATAAGEAATTLVAPDLEAKAQAVLGDALLARRAPEEALDAYRRAEAAAERAGDPEACARARLNRATALLQSAGDLQEVEACLAAPARGAEPAEVAARRRVLSALHGLLRGRLAGGAAAEELDAALELARREGAYAVVLRYAELPARLRARAAQVQRAQ
ncbi:MAG: hypothetical protein AB7N76_10860 [Planctomycetota bacterium]